MFPGIGNKKSHGPRARLCYICGRQTLLAGFNHHVEGCSKLFIQREALKPIRERRALPVDPMLSMGAGFDGALNVGNNLDQINALSQQAYNDTLSVCQFCGRKFVPEKLAIHNRSCRADNPARRVDESVNRRQGQDHQVSPTQPSLPSPSQMKQPSTRQLLNRPSSQQSQSKLSATEPIISHEQPIKSSQYPEYSNSMPPGMPLGGEDIVPAMFRQCPDCGRKFNETAYEKHVKICRKVFIEKRKEFDSQKHRVEGTEMAALPTNKRSQSASATTAPNNSSIKSAKHSSHRSNSALPKWKADSDAFRQAMKQARQVSVAEKKSKETGIPLAQLLPSKPSDPANDPIYASYIQCPTCGRRFNETAGARHIPKCRDILAKPSRLISHSGQQATTAATTSKVVIGYNKPSSRNGTRR
jgi:hypothetical protein